MKSSTGEYFEGPVLGLYGVREGKFARAQTRDRFGNGWLYVLPRESFRPEPLELGVLDTAHWASPTAVTPLVRIAVSASDFPFADRIVSHAPGERMLVTILRASRARGAGKSG